MGSETGKKYDKLFRNLSNLAKKHDVAADIILDGSRAVTISLKSDGEKLLADVKINDLKKVLTTPELLKAGLSFISRKKEGQSRIEVNIDTGFFRKLFGKNKL